MDDTEEFMDAMKKADDDFVTVMDLRRKLEEAYRRSQP
jgi:flagellar hook-basal body complex protein FliE